MLILLMRAGGVKDLTTKFSVLSLDRKAVTFSILGDDTFPAGSKGKIQFRFTADSTPIRNGWVAVRIPADLGSAPTESDVAGKIKVDGGDKASGDHTTAVNGLIRVNLKGWGSARRSQLRMAIRRLSSARCQDRGQFKARLRLQRL